MTTSAPAVQSPSAFYVDGRWVPVPDRETLSVVDPSTEREVATVPAGTREDVDVAVAAARAAF
jgi:acyl-CoA reductase-like NAD-dependent aldehyde dehydrogenase